MIETLSERNRVQNPAYRTTLFFFLITLISGAILCEIILLFFLFPKLRVGFNHLLMFTYVIFISNIE